MQIAWLSCILVWPGVLSQGDAVPNCTYTEVESSFLQTLHGSPHESPCTTTTTTGFDISWAQVKLEMRKLYRSTDLYRLQTSTNETFPLNYVPEIDFGKVSFFGSVTYFDILLPDFYETQTYLPYSIDQSDFLVWWQTELDVRVAALGSASTQVPAVVGGDLVHDVYQVIVEKINHPLGRKNALFPFVQGYDQIWEGDTYAGTLIGHSFLAVMLENTSSGELVLDLLGNGTATTPVQIMKNKAVALVPNGLLKTRGYLSTVPELSLVGVDVEDSDGNLMHFDPSQGTQWSLAKMALFAQALFVEECFHTGMHLFAGSVISAIKKSLPAGTPLGGVVGPQTLQVLFALLEQAALLHSDHNSAFSGEVWQTDNITAVWVTTMDMARFFLDSTPQDILGMSEPRPSWWAGMSGAFIAPISSFAGAVAGQVAADSQGNLATLQDELKNVGILTSANSMDVTTVAGLTTLLTNLLFVPSICHSHMYQTREAFTPLMGWTTTIEFLPYLQASRWQKSPLATVLQLAFPTTPGTLTLLLNLMYATGGGFNDEKAVPQLGDGPYYNLEGQAGIQDSIKIFRAALKETRQSVYEAFGDFNQDTFVPGYYYPVEIPKPFGYATTQTTYI